MTEDHWPRDRAHRYRIYRGGSVVAATPDKEGVGTTLVTLAEEGELDGYAVGVLDVLAPPGSGRAWVVNPHERGGA